VFRTHESLLHRAVLEKHGKSLFTHASPIYIRAQLPLPFERFSEPCEPNVRNFTIVERNIYAGLTVYGADQRRIHTGIRPRWIPKSAVRTECAQNAIRRRWLDSPGRGDDSSAAAIFRLFCLVYDGNMKALLFCFLAVSVLAQTANIPLPVGAKVIETAKLTNRVDKSRALVLWMLNPTKGVRRGELGCSDVLYGDRWYGPTRLSLIDSGKRTVINTIEIRGFYEGSDDYQHSFPIPYYVSNENYYVPQTDKNGEGTPKILNLRDLTGEGVAGQFVLFEYEACGVSLTTVLGYSPRTDTVKQFPVKIIDSGEKTTIVSWVPHLFGEQPVQPGHWNITWDPGHGCDCIIHEEVSFNPIRQLFVENRRVTAYPKAALPKSVGQH